MKVSFMFTDCFINEKKKGFFDATIKDLIPAFSAWKNEIALPELDKAERNKFNLLPPGERVFKCRGCGENAEGKFIASSATIIPLEEICENCGHLHDMFIGNCLSICECPVCSDRLSRVIKQVHAKNILITETFFNKESVIDISRKAVVMEMGLPFDTLKDVIPSFHISNDSLIYDKVKAALFSRTESFFENEKLIKSCIQNPTFTLSQRLYDFIVKLEVDVLSNGDWN